MDILLALLQRLQRRFVLQDRKRQSVRQSNQRHRKFTDLREASPDRTGLLRAEVKRQVLLVLVELPQVLPLLLVRDRQNPGDRLADSVADE